MVSWEKEGDGEKDKAGCNRLWRKSVFLMNRGICCSIFFLIVFCGPTVRKGCAQDCEEAKAWYKAAEALNDQSQREVYYYKKVIELCPDHFEAHNRLGLIYTSWGQFDLAIESFKKAARRPSYAEPHKNLGEVYRMQGQYDLAVEEFTEAVRIEPDMREAQNQLKYVQKRLGKFASTLDAPPEPLPSPIFTTLPGMALPKGAYIFDSKYRYMSREAGLAGQRIEFGTQFGQPSRKMEVHAWIVGLRYGVTNNLTIGLIPKYFFKDTEVDIPTTGVEANPAVSGLGDTVFMTKYRLWGKRHTHFSVFHLLSIPTGDEDAEGEDQGVIRRIPQGSGSYDFQPGLAITAELADFMVHNNVSYLLTGGRSAGDEFHCDLALDFPRWNDFVSSIELNYQWVDDSVRETLFQTRFGFQPSAPGLSPGPFTETGLLYEEGGHYLYLSPGVQFFFTDEFKGEFGLQVPLMSPQDAWVNELVIHMGITMYFF